MFYYSLPLSSLLILRFVFFFYFISRFSSDSINECVVMIIEKRFILHTLIVIPFIRELQSQSDKILVTFLRTHTACSNPVVDIESFVKMDAWKQRLNL